MNKLAALQILRGLAASIVVVDHSLLRQAEWTPYSAMATTAAQFSGTLGVAVFFVISGYIMIFTSGNRFGQPGFSATFLRKRLIRIVPLYWTATLLEIALRLRKGGSIDLHHLLGSLFFVPQAVVPGDYMRPLLGVGWTLNYEMFFYVIFTIALMCGKKTGLGIVFFILGGLVLLGTTIKPLTDTEPPHTLFGFWTDPIMLLFAAGVVIGLIPRIEKWQQMIAYPVTLAAALLGACLTAFLVLHVIFPPPLYWQVGVWLTCSVVVALCIFGRPPRESRTTRGLVHLGDMSYALYLFHFFAVIAAEKMWWLLFGKNPSLLFIPAAYVLSVVSAHAVHHLIEANFDRVLGGRATGGVFRRTAATSDTNPSAAAATQYSPSRPASSAAGVSIRRK